MSYNQSTRSFCKEHYTSSRGRPCDRVSPGTGSAAFFGHPATHGMTLKKLLANGVPPKDVANNLRCVHSNIVSMGAGLRARLAYFCLPTFFFIYITCLLSIHCNKTIQNQSCAMGIPFSQFLRFKSIIRIHINRNFDPRIEYIK